MRDPEAIAVAAEEAFHEPAIRLEIIHYEYTASTVCGDSQMLGNRQRRLQSHNPLIGNRCAKSSRRER